MKPGIAIPVILAVSAVVTFAAARVNVRWMYGAARARSRARSIVLIACASVLLFAASLASLVSLLAFVAVTLGRDWAEGPRWFALLAGWAAAMVPGFWHQARHARRISEAFRAKLSRGTVGSSKR